MLVCCLEGCHGVGKSTILAKFKSLGMNVLDEAFVDMPSYSLHPQTLTMESIWITNWFQRLLKLQQDDPNGFYICDRSPYCAELYARQGKYAHVLQPFIQEQIKELKELADIEVYTVHLNVAPDLLWSRILERLALEPEREKFDENNPAWMRQVLEWYNTHEWDFNVDNNGDMQQNTDAILNVVRELLQQLHKQLPSFRALTRVEAISAVTWDNDRGIILRS